jgi:hypothetical protein
LWDVFKNSHNALNVSVLENYGSGLPYGAVGAVDSRPYVKNPGYVLPPATVGYYYTARDQFRTDNINSTDIAVNYSFLWAGPFNKQYEVFIEPEILNVFNAKGIIRPDNTVFDATTDSSLKTFNPFTTTPVQGVNWRKGANFGKGINATDFQLPRTFRFSVGFRF